MNPSETDNEVNASGELKKQSVFLATGWLVTNIALAIAELPLKFLLKDNLYQSPQQVSRFFAIGQFSNYIKPVAGIITDAFPFRGTRRRHYLLAGLGIGGLLWVVIGLVPQTPGWLLAAYTLFYLTVVLVSTTLGGRMVEVGNAYHASGRLTAQRIGMFRLATLVGGPIAGKLAKGHAPFLVVVLLSAALHFGLTYMVWVQMQEPPTAIAKSEVWGVAWRQIREMCRNRVIIAAGIMIFLIALAPGFNTPLLFHQTNVLHFDQQFVGNLLAIQSLFGLIGAWVYYHTCRKWTVQQLLIFCIIAHAIGTLSYLGYKSPLSAIIITAIGGITIALTQLPPYDIASRATPKGSEALGYSVMMSVWNFTNALSDWTGSVFFDSFHRQWSNLIYLNAVTTLLALVAIPFLPAALRNGRDRSMGEVRS